MLMRTIKLNPMPCALSIINWTKDPHSNRFGWIRNRWDSSVITAKSENNCPRKHSGLVPQRANGKWTFRQSSLNRNECPPGENRFEFRVNERSVSESYIELNFNLSITLRFVVVENDLKYFIEFDKGPEMIPFGHCVVGTPFERECVCSTNESVKHSLSIC